jgi:hypothetical protein
MCTRLVSPARPGWSRQGSPPRDPPGDTRHIRTEFIGNVLRLIRSRRGPPDASPHTHAAARVTRSFYWQIQRWGIDTRLHPRAHPVFSQRGGLSLVRTQPPSADGSCAVFLCGALAGSRRAARASGPSGVCHRARPVRQSNSARGSPFPAVVRGSPACAFPIHTAQVATTTPILTSPLCARTCFIAALLSAPAAWSSGSSPALARVEQLRPFTGLRAPPTREVSRGARCLGPSVLHNVPNRATTSFYTGAK